MQLVDLTSIAKPFIIEPDLPVYITIAACIFERVLHAWDQTL